MLGYSIKQYCTIIDFWQQYSSKRERFEFRFSQERKVQKIEFPKQDIHQV